MNNLFFDIVNFFIKYIECVRINLINKFSKTNDIDEKNNVPTNLTNPNNKNKRRRYYSKKIKKILNQI